MSFSSNQDGFCGNIPLWKRCLNVFWHEGDEFPTDRSTNLTYLFICLALIVLPFFMGFSSGDKGQLQMAGVKLPPSCISREFFGVSCPGCGMSRSFVALAHFHFIGSLGYHRLGVLLYLFFVYQVILRICVLVMPSRDWSAKWQKLQNRIAAVIIFLLVANWFVGLWVGGN